MNLQLSRPLPGTVPDDRYPDSNGRFMGETDFHNIAVIRLREGLEDHFAVQQVYVASNLVFYYQEGDARRRRDPDVLVAKGVGKHRRRSYRLWEERVMPCTLFEVASRRTWRRDLREQRQQYAQLRVKEYFVFDPEDRYLDPVLQGFRSVRGESVPMKPAADGSLLSREFGLRMVPEGEMLRLIDTRTGEPVLTRSEGAEQERQRAEALAAEVQRLQALLARREQK